MPVNNNYQELLDLLQLRSLISSRGRAQRILELEAKKVLAGFLSKLLNLIFKKSLLLKTDLFWGRQIIIPAPLGLEFYFYGCKIHPSEIKLAKFLINTIKSKDIFFDVGTHLGYYSLLAGYLADEGQIHSFEPSPIFNFLQKNLKSYSNIFANNLALADKNSIKQFIVLPLIYSENDSLNQELVDSLGERFKKISQKIEIQTITLDDYCKTKKAIPDIIKIDAEGSELEVLKGGKDLFSKYNPVITMEFNSESEIHKNSIKFLKNKNYDVFGIDSNGSLFKPKELKSDLEIIVLKKLT